MEGELDLSILTNIPIQVHIFPNIKYSLVTIVELCDTGCTVIFNIKDVIVVYKDDIILLGWKTHQNKLWYFPLISRELR